MSGVITRKFINTFKSNVTQFHSLIKHNNLNGTLLEEIIHNSFVECGHNCDWTPRSSKQGSDISVDDLDISIKSGRIKKNKLVISSYRTKQQKTLDDKISFLSDKHEDFILSIPYNEETNTYSMYIFDIHDIIDFNNIDWYYDEKGWYCGNDSISIGIHKSMGDQTWYEIDINNAKLHNRCVIKRS